MNKPTGGSAFPNVHVSPDGTFVVQEFGATLRDFFAAKALQGLLADCSNGFDVENSDPEAIARHAFRLADAMVKVRDE